MLHVLDKIFGVSVFNMPYCIICCTRGPVQQSKNQYHHTKQSCGEVPYRDDEQTVNTKLLFISLYNRQGQRQRSFSCVHCLYHISLFLTISVYSSFEVSLLLLATGLSVMAQKSLPSFKSQLQSVSL